MSHAVDHVDEAQLHAYLDRQLQFSDAEVRRAVGLHIADCSKCSALLKEVRRVHHGAHNILEVSEPSQRPAPSFQDIVERAAERRSAQDDMESQTSRFLRADTHDSRIAGDEFEIDIDIPESTNDPLRDDAQTVAADEPEQEVSDLEEHIPDEPEAEENTANFASEAKADDPVAQFPEAQDREMVEEPTIADEPIADESIDKPFELETTPAMPQFEVAAEPTNDVVDAFWNDDVSRSLESEVADLFASAPEVEEDADVAADETPPANDQDDLAHRSEADDPVPAPETQTEPIADEKEIVFVTSKPRLAPEPPRSPISSTRSTTTHKPKRKNRGRTLARAAIVLLAIGIGGWYGRPYITERFVPQMASDATVASEAVEPASEQEAEPQTPPQGQ